MPKPTPQQCHALITYYTKLFKQKYGTEPVVNRHAARWGFDSILQGMPPADAKALLDFYFTTNAGKRHNLDWFFYHYHELQESQTEADKDRAAREKLRRESQIRAEEWRARGNTGIAND